MLVWCILSRRAVPISSHNNPHPSHPNDRHPNFVAGCIQQRRAISHISKFKSILCVLPREVQTCTNIAGCEDSILPVPNPFSVGTRDCLSVFFHSWVIEVFVWVVWYPVISHHCKGQQKHAFNVTNLLLASLKAQSSWMQSFSGIPTPGCLGTP